MLRIVLGRRKEVCISTRLTRPDSVTGDERRERPRVQCARSKHETRAFTRDDEAVGRSGVGAEGP